MDDRIASVDPEVSKAIFGSKHFLTVIAAAARFDGDIFTRKNLWWLTGISDGSIIQTLERLTRVGILVMFPREEWDRTYRYASIPGPAWDALKQLAGVV